MIPLPDGLEWEEWWPYVVEEFALDGVPTSLPWEEAVSRVQVYSSSSLPDMPSPYGFNDWREWARRAMTLLA